MIQSLDSEFVSNCEIPSVTSFLSEQVNYNLKKYYILFWDNLSTFNINFKNNFGNAQMQIQQMSETTTSTKIILFISKRSESVWILVKKVSEIRTDYFITCSDFRHKFVFKIGTDCFIWVIRFWISDTNLCLKSKQFVWIPNTFACLK